VRGSGYIMTGFPRLTAKWDAIQDTRTVDKA
jgi:hypothetical protein